MQHWYIYNYRYIGYMFRLYRVIFRPSNTTDPIFTRQSSALWDPQCLHNSIVTILLCKHWGSHSALDYLVKIGSVVFEGLKMTR